METSLKHGFAPICLAAQKIGVAHNFFFLGGRGLCLPPPLPQSQYTYGNHALEHNDVDTSIPVCTCTIMTWFLLTCDQAVLLSFLFRRPEWKGAWYIYFTRHLPVALNLYFCLIHGNTKEPLEPCTDWLLHIPLFCNFSLGDLSLYWNLL